MSHVLKRFFVFEDEVGCSHVFVKLDLPLGARARKQREPLRTNSLHFRQIFSTELLAVVGYQYVFNVIINVYLLNALFSPSLKDSYFVLRPFYSKAKLKTLINNLLPRWD